MDEKEGIQQQFEKDVEWLQRSVPVDHIYGLAQQLLTTAEYFLDRWKEWADLQEEISRNVETYNRVRCIVQILMLKKCDTDACIREYLRNGKIG